MNTLLNTQNTKAGFTLVEMIVTVAIFAMISSVILTRNAAFDTEVLLNSLAYEVGLSVREAQQFGINVRTSEGQFDRAYGIFFERERNTYYLFADKNGDQVYNAPGELVQTYTLGRGTKIFEICDLAVSGCSLSSLTVVFERPDPDAIINQGTMAQAKIGLQEPRGGLRYIYIYSTGQVSVRKL